MRYLRFLLVGLSAVLVTGALAASVSDGSTHSDPLTAEAGPSSRDSRGIPVPVAPQGALASALGRALPGTLGVKNPRMSSDLVRLAQAERGARATGATIDALSLSLLDPDLQAMADLRLLRIDSRGRVQAYVLVGTTVDEALADVSLVGGQVERTDESAGIVQALIPIGQLEALAQQSSVKFIRLPDYGFPGAGSVTTAGDSILGAGAMRTALGVDGTGVSVGVISDGVGGLAASQASGDLPAVNITTCNVAGSDPTLSGAEGTAMLEIVHDLAPGAELWFGNFGLGTSLDFNAAVDCLAANTDIVVDDVGWLNVGPYDGTSIVSVNTSTELNRVSNPLRAYANAVGNQADRHYQEPFVDSGFDLDLGGGPLWDMHRFQQTAGTSDAGWALQCDVNSPGVFCTDSVFLADGGSVAFLLQWDDPFGGSGNDYDLFLFDEAGALVDGSVDPQTGSQDPVEVVAGTNNSGQGQFFDVRIGRAAGAAARTFDMFVTCSGCAILSNGAIHNFNTPGSSVPNQSDAGGGVISVGAINASDPGNDTIATYSSRGPTNDNRVKPDISGIDCVSVTGAGGFGSPFCGTSAAAPHIAGIAALLLECNPGLLAGEPGDNPSSDRTALRDALLSNAVDLGAAGVDNLYGYGRADASASAAAVCADSDGDGVFDTIDNCPAWPNAGQSLPPWPIPADDPDCDGWSTADENIIGTLWNVHCAATAVPDDEPVDASPPDFDDNQLVDIFDVNAMRPPIFNLQEGKGTNPFYSARFDLNVDDFVDIFDVNAMRPPVFNLSVACTP